MAATDQEPTSADHGEAMGEIARQGGPQAVGLITTLLEQSARERDSIRASLYASMEQERDEWRDYARELEAKLNRIRGRFYDLLEVD